MIETWTYLSQAYVIEGSKSCSSRIQDSVVRMCTTHQFSYQLCPTLRNTVDYSTPGLPFHHQLPELTQTHVHWVSDAIQPSHPLSSPSPPTFNLPQQKGLSQWVSSSHQVAKGGFSFSISPSIEYSGLISFRTDWLNLLAAQGTLKGLLQHHSSKASILQCSAFFYSSTLTSIHDY